MDMLEAQFNNLKISALSKLKYINEQPIDLDQTIQQQQKTAQRDDSKEELDGRDQYEPQNQQIMSIQKVLVQAEVKRQQDIKLALNARQQKIRLANEKQADTLKLEWEKRQQKMRDFAQKKDEMIKSILNFEPKHSNVADQTDHQFDLRDRSKLIEEQLKKEKEKQHMKAMIDCVIKCQVLFRNYYEHIGLLSKTNGNSAAVSKIYFEKSPVLASLTENLNKIITLCKERKVTNKDVSDASDIVQQMKELKDSIAAEIANITTAANPVVEKRPVEVTEPPKAIIEIKDSPKPPPPEYKPEAPHLNRFFGNYVSKSALKTYTELQQFHEEYEKIYQNLKDNDQLKKLRFGLQKGVNIPLNAISGVSAHHLIDKFDRLSDLLKGKFVEVGGTRVRASEHPEGIAFCTDLLAKKFVIQGDLIVSSNPDSAFAYASVIVALWDENPVFGKLLMYHFHELCPYLVPIYMPQTTGQTDEEYYKSLGYQYIDGVVEKQDKFLQRMSGIVRLYCAVMVTKPRRLVNKPHPYFVQNGWRWLANLLNLEPRPDTTATLLYDFLDVAGNALQAAYGKQFNKLLEYLQNDFMPKLQIVNKDIGLGPVVRLEEFLKKVKKNGGKIEAPRARIPREFGEVLIF